MASFKLFVAFAAFALLFAFAAAQQETATTATDAAVENPIVAHERTLAELEARKVLLLQESAAASTAETAAPEDPKRATKLARLDEKILRAKYKIDAAKFYQGLQDALASRPDLAEPAKAPAGTPKLVLTAEERAASKIESLRRRIAREKFVLDYLTANPEPVEPAKTPKAPKAVPAEADTPAPDAPVDAKAQKKAAKRAAVAQDASTPAVDAAAAPDVAAIPATPAVPRSERKLSKLKAKIAAAASVGSVDASDAQGGAPVAVGKKYADIATLERRLKFEEAWLAHAGKASIDAVDEAVAALGPQSSAERAQARLVRLEQKLARKEFESAWISENGPIETPPAAADAPAAAADAAPADAAAAHEAVVADAPASQEVHA
eukprot:Opistho-2@58899